MWSTNSRRTSNRSKNWCVKRSARSPPNTPAPSACRTPEFSCQSTSRESSAGRRFALALVVGTGLPGRPSPSQRVDQFAIRPYEIDGVIGVQPRVAAWVQLDQPIGSRDGDDAGLGGHFEHAQPVKLTAGGHMHSADDKGALAHRERAQYLQADRGADEPGCCLLDGGAHILKTEALRYREAQRAVVNAQYQRNIGPVLLGRRLGAQHFGEHNAGFDVNDV